MEDFSAQARQTHDFAAQTTATVRTVCLDAPDYVAQAAVRKNIWKATVATPGDKPVALTVAGRRLLRLKVSYECTASPRHSFMVVEKSAFILLPAQGSEPLVRLEYLRHPNSDWTFDGDSRFRCDWSTYDALALTCPAATSRSTPTATTGPSP
ncbi:hypothetical protein [Actinomyces sp. 2119]|uniref:hypothetical protein n=1 Tax=Actinomyces sp. 2119 TaxID=2321393 RepID=UPI002176112B|nr:hypothetical protein [Actinomyces sp. 2119]